VETLSSTASPENKPPLDSTACSEAALNREHRADLSTACTALFHSDAPHLGAINLLSASIAMRGACTFPRIGNPSTIPVGGERMALKMPMLRHL
jgi:hypothetical protein